MAKLRGWPNFRAYLFEHLWDPVHIKFFVECRAGLPSFLPDTLACGDKAAATIRPELHSDIAKAFCDGLLYRVDCCRCVGSTGVVVAGHGVTNLSSEQFVNRHSSALAFYVPK